MYIVRRGTKSIKRCVVGADRKPEALTAAEKCQAEKEMARELANPSSGENVSVYERKRFIL